MIRAFLPAAAVELEKMGVTHIIDFASGIPVNHLDKTLTTARIVYSDLEPNTIKVGKSLVEGKPNVIYLEADVKKPLELLNNEIVKQHLGEIKQLAIGLSGIAAFLSPEEYHEIANAIYNWAPSGTLLYSEFDGKESLEVTEKFGQFMELMKTGLGGTYYMYSEVQYRKALEPWEIIKFAKLQDFLNMPADSIQAEDHEGVGLQLYACIARKP